MKVHKDVTRKWKEVDKKGSKFGILSSRNSERYASRVLCASHVTFVASGGARSLSYHADCKDGGQLVTNKTYSSSPPPFFGCLLSSWLARGYE
jgi:hypothetical protein